MMSAGPSGGYGYNLTREKEKEGVSVARMGSLATYVGCAPSIYRQG